MIDSKKHTYFDLIEYLMSLTEFEQFGRIIEYPPFCYVRTKTPFYEWAKVKKDPVPPPSRFENHHHCLLELNQPTSLVVLNSMAQCIEFGWLPCPYMLRAAAKSVDLNLLEPKGKLDPVTFWVLKSLDYLLDDFANGGDFINTQETYEICLYRVQILKGFVLFKDSSPSGLEDHLRLAAFVELAIHFGFYIESEKIQDLLDRDIALIFRNVKIPRGLRMVSQSFVALYDSGLMPRASSRKTHRTSRIPRNLIFSLYQRR